MRRSELLHTQNESGLRIGKLSILKIDLENGVPPTFAGYLGRRGRKGW